MHNFNRIGCAFYRKFTSADTEAYLFSSVKKILSGLVILITLFSSGLLAQSITPQMLQQLQSLPRSQQEALAKQYGIDVDAILGGVGGQAGPKSNIAMPGEPLEPIKPLNDEELLEKETWRLFQEKYAEFKKSQEDKDEKQRYGVSIFDREVSTFAPTDDASVPDSYRLGAGDHLVLQLFGKDSSEHDLQLSREGKISIPKLGPITLAGLTFEDARDLVKSRVAEQLLGVQAVISMGSLRAINLFMAGEVAVPGAYSVSALTTITQALFQAGGISEIGSLRNIQVKRDGREVAKLDVYQLLLKGDASGDVRLQSGDVVFVPPYVGLITVEGAVNRPMIYEYVDGESVSDAIFMAGGPSEDAYMTAISVVRKAIGRSLAQVKNVDLTNPEVTPVLRNGDLIKVPLSTDTLQNAITIEGAVVRPGVYGWVHGQTISDLLSSIEGDLKVYADIDYAVIVRQKSQRLDIDVLQVNLEEALSKKGSEHDILTAPRDRIIIFAQPGIDNGDMYDGRSQKQQKGQYLSESNANKDSQSSDVAQSAGAQSSNTSQYSKNYRDENSLSRDINEEEDPAAELNEEIAASQRFVLLAPIIQQLTAQASSGEPVQIVSISGAVKSPGVFPLGAGDTVAKLLYAAGGLRDDAYLNASELRSLYVADNSEVVSRYSVVDLQAELNSVSGVLLKSRDHLHVRALPDWNPDDSVTLEGEVRFPGEYRIRKGESMSRVLERAGGLLPTAFARGTVFTRESIAEKENLRAKEFAQVIVRDFASSQLTKETNNIKIDEIKAVADILEDFVGIGRLLVNVNAALSGDDVADLGLEDGDRLVVPQRNSTVTVVGEIRRPGTHSYQAGLDLEDYLSLSAGVGARGDLEELYVVRADGSVFRPVKSWTLFAGSEATLMPGDTIVVPIDAGYTDRLSMWRDVTQVIFNSTAGLATILAATK